MERVHNCTRFFCIMFFDDVLNMLSRAKNLNEDLAWLLSIDNGVKKEIIRLNTIDQLHDKGIDSLGRSLGDYSEISVEVFGKRPGHITLEDTGDFYHSFSVTVQKDGFTINSNTRKVDTDLSVRFGKEITGLTDENIEIIKEMILANIIKYVKKQLGI